MSEDEGEWTKDKVKSLVVMSQTSKGRVVRLDFCSAPLLVPTQKGVVAPQGRTLCKIDNTRIWKKWRVRSGLKT